MTRRDFLRAMGVGVAAAASSKVLSQINVPENRVFTTSNGKKRLVFFFTGTGNSLYAAKQFSDQPISIPQIIHNDNLVFEADEIGLVYPVYAHMPPAIVRQFLEKATLNAPYKFAVATYGKRKCNSVEILEHIAGKAGVNFDYITTINMVDNFIAGFDMDEEIKLDKHEEEQFAQAIADVEAHKVWKQPFTEEERQVHIDRFGDNYDAVMSMNCKQIFTIDKERCVKCGICTKVCPKGNFSLTPDGVTNEGDCLMCLSCTHNCPKKAVKFNMPEVNPNARYRNPHISLQEIIRANQQKQ